MERIQAAVLAVVIAAAVLFGLGYVVDEPLVWRPGRAVDERARVAVWNDGGRETRRRVIAGGGHADDDAPPRRVGFGNAAPRLERGTFLSDGVLPVTGRSARMPADLLAARSGLLPASPPARPRSAGDAPPPPPAEEADEREPEPELLLSVPFEGSLMGENGDAAVHAEGVLFNGNAIEFTNEARVVFPSAGNVDGAAGTISFEITPRWAGSDPASNAFVHIRDPDVWENSLQIVKNLGSLRFIIVDERGRESDVTASIVDWQPDRARVVTATWDRERMSLYVDRAWVGGAERQHALRIADTTAIQVGSAGFNYGGAGGQIRNFRIYSSALDDARIAGR